MFKKLKKNIFVAKIRYTVFLHLKSGYTLPV